jgi:Domain of unknown function (DUF4331)
MRKSILSVATVAALAAGTLAVTGATGSSHREAPDILKKPLKDNTDVYAFTAPDAPNALTVVANWIPLADAAGGPNFYPLDENARYYVKIDNTGDGYEDVAYRWEFKTKYRNPNSFLYAVPPVNRADDPNVLQAQTYNLYKETYNRNRRLVDTRRIAKNVPVVPDNVGPKTIPDFAKVEASGVAPLKGGGKVIVAPADDAFFVDLGALFDGINIDKPGRPNIGLGNQGGGKDDVAGYNTKSFVLQVPESEVTRNGKPVSDAKANNAVVGVWSTTEEQAMPVRGSRGSKGTSARSSQGRGDWVQVSRLGNPLINEVMIPVGRKDKFNATSPADDRRNFGKFALNPEPARLLNLLFGLGVKETNRTDIVQALLTGIPGLTQIAKDAVPADTLKTNLGVPPSAKPNRFGLLARDQAGFPNGRRLTDDAVDIELRVIAGALLPANKGGKQIPLGDGVDQNDKPFRQSFPYVALANDGFNSTLKRVEPQHAPVPQPPPAQLP